MPVIKPQDVGAQTLQSVPQAAAMRSLVMRPDPHRDPLRDILHHISLYGAPKTGKTMCAATFSDKIPADARFPLEKRVVIDDMLYVMFDGGGCLSLELNGIQVPMLDLSGMTALRPLEIGGLKLQVDNWEQPVFDMIREMVIKEGIRAVVWDSVSSYCRILEPWSDIGDSFASNTRMRNKVITLHTYSRTIPCTQIFNFHAKMPVGIEGSNNQKMQTQADNMHNRLEALGAGSANIIIDCPTSAASLFRGNTINTWPVIKLGPDGKERRVILPFGGYGWEGGSRFQEAWIKREEEPNINAIFAKVRAKLDRKTTSALLWSPRSIASGAG